eukprot:scaffold185480_cov34-Cyclotella_meneghiniana.AAC.1
MCAKGREPNWTNYLGRVMSVINNQRGRGRYAETAFKAVFGQEYQLPVRSECSTLEEHLRDNPDSRFQAVAKELCFTEGEGIKEVDDDESYWDDDDMSLESMENDEDDAGMADIGFDDEILGDGNGDLLEAAQEIVNEVLQEEDGKPNPIMTEEETEDFLTEIAKDLPESPSPSSLTKEGTDPDKAFLKTSKKEASKKDDSSSPPPTTKVRTKYPVDKAWENGKC